MKSGINTRVTIASVGTIRTKDGNYCGNDLSIAPVQRHSGRVTHTAEDD